MCSYIYNIITHTYITYGKTCYYLAEMHHLCGLKIVFKKAQCVLVKDPFSVAGGCLFLANLLLALWTIGPRCACDAVRAVASSGRLVPPRQEEFWEVFFGHLLYVSQVTSWLGYGRSCCCHSDQGPLKAGYLARRVHLFQRFSKSPPPNSGFVAIFGDWFGF